MYSLLQQRLHVTMSESLESVYMLKLFGTSSDEYFGCLGINIFENIFESIVF